MDEPKIPVYLLCDNPEVRHQLEAVAERCGCVVVPIDDSIAAFGDEQDEYGILAAFFEHVEPVHLRFVTKVSQRRPKSRVLVIGGEDTAAAAVDMMRAGAEYYVAADDLDVRLLDALDHLAQEVRAEMTAAEEADAMQEGEASLSALREMLKELMIASRQAMATLEQAPSAAAGAKAQGMWFAETGMSMRELERRAIEQALRECNRNRTRAANLLQISIRTLHRKIREYNLA